MNSRFVPMEQFRARRVPGTLTLAVTNLCAATVLVDPATMRDVDAHRIALEILPVTAWGVLFLVTGVGLTVAAVTRLSFLLHVFGAISVGVWLAVSLSALIVNWTDPDVSLSGIALALFAWMLGGPLAMLLVPLLAERYERHERGT